MSKIDEPLRDEVLLYVVYEDFNDVLELVELRALKQPSRYKVLTRRDAIGYRTFLQLDDSRIGKTPAEAKQRYIDRCREVAIAQHEEARRADQRVLAAEAL